MSKYFDNTFFKFLFGFLAILFASFVIIGLIQWWDGGEARASQVDMEASQPQYYE